MLLSLLISATIDMSFQPIVFEPHYFTTSPDFQPCTLVFQQLASETYRDIFPTLSSPVQNTQSLHPYLHDNFPSFTKTVIGMRYAHSVRGSFLASRCLRLENIMTLQIIVMCIPKSRILPKPSMSAHTPVLLH
jgi:hypothetical protein